jgi:BirA family biotin operon repressor/biotin-[acetyl-CoA-carboxylase] ligase
MTDEFSEYSLYKALCRNKKLKISACNPSDIKGLLDKNLIINEINGYYEIQQPIVPLVSAEIYKHLQHDIIKCISDLVIKYQVTSTNISIHEYEYKHDYLVMLAEYQQAGKGRRAKKWYSPLGSNIYLSIKFIHANSEYAHFVPLVTALALCTGLAYLGIKGCMIKWPNDIYVNEKKIAGILAENRYNPNIGNTCVVGIGLNVNMGESPAIDQDWTSLALEQKKLFDRNRVTALLLSEIIHQYEKLQDFDVTEFIYNWHKYDYLRGKPIMVHSDKTDYEAVATGLSKDGSLQISVNGRNKKIYSAEVSVLTRV